MELESTVSMTLQQKSIVDDTKLAPEITTTATAKTTSVSSSGFQTPRVASSIRFEDENNSETTATTRDHNESSVEAFNSPPSPIQVKNRQI